MKVGSLCTGYGGLEMAVETTHGPIDLRFVSDNDNDVNKLLQYHHPTTPNLGDLTNVDWASVEPVDLICAGYPCQPYSTAGKRKGNNDERAIFEHIADAIGTLRPRWLLLENVTGHITLGGTAVVATLTKLGYDATWGVIRASDAGAPHKRARLFIVAQTSNASCGNGRQKESKSMGPTARQTTKLRKPNRAHYGPYEHAIRRWETITERTAPQPVDTKGVTPAFVEWLMGLPLDYVNGLDLSRTAKLTILGNGVVPQQAALAIQLLTQQECAK